MKTLRWLVLIPAAAVGGFLTSMVAGIPLSIAHGWDFINELLNAPDMAGRYVVGTYCLLMIRGALGAGSTWAAYRIAPSAKLRAAYSWLMLLVVVFGAMLLYTNIILERAHLQLTFSAGYRIIVEALGLLGGSFLAIQILRGSDESKQTGLSPIDFATGVPAIDRPPTAHVKNLELVSAYGRVLEKQVAGLLRPESTLPASKEEIKAALVAVAVELIKSGLTRNSDRWNALAGGYASLADFAPDEIALRENDFNAALREAVETNQLSDLALSEDDECRNQTDLAIKEFSRLAEEFKSTVARLTEVEGSVA